jgi:hypothetical protein
MLLNNQHLKTAQKGDQTTKDHTAPRYLASKNQQEK